METPNRPPCYSRQALIVFICIFSLFQNEAYAHTNTFLNNALLDLRRKTEETGNEYATTLHNSGKRFLTGCRNIKGTQNSIQITRSCLYIKPGEHIFTPQYIHLHSHPGYNPPSPADIKVLKFYHKEMHIITLDGSIYMIQPKINNTGISEAEIDNLNTQLVSLEEKISNRGGGVSYKEELFAACWYILLQHKAPQIGIYFHSHLSEKMNTILTQKKDEVYNLTGLTLQ